MAGRGSRFAKEGYTLPKPLIPVHQTPMIKMVINNLTPKQPHRFIFLCLSEHMKEYQLEEKLKAWAPGCEVIEFDTVTEGAACTVLVAKEFINNDDALMIANSDQWVDCSIDTYLAAMEEKNMDGLIMTMKANDPKWSYVRLNSQGWCTEVIEKVVVSDEATVGIYNFRHGKDYVRAAEQMIAKDLRVNGEFYVAPTYNQLIEEDAKIGFYNIGAELDGMYGTGIPSDLKKFEALPVSLQAARP